MAIAWIDLETTGLDPQIDDILEWGVVITDDSLGELATLSIPVTITGAYEKCDETVRMMHAASGLWADIDDHGVSPLEAIEEVGRLLAAHFDAEDHVVLGGSGIDRFDVPFIAVHAQQIHQRVYYRTLDTSLLKRMLKDVGIEVPLRPHLVEHRALDDALWSLDVYKKGREVMFEGAEAIRL